MGQSQIAEHNRRKGEKEQKAGDLSCPCFAYVLAQLGPFMGKIKIWAIVAFFGKMFTFGIFRYFVLLCNVVSVFFPDSFCCKVLASSI